MNTSLIVYVINLESGSVHYERFLTALGEKTALANFKGFAGGLDTTHGKTGTHMIYSKWKNFEVMFHCSTLLPYLPDDLQHIERKRHIGNGNLDS